MRILHKVVVKLYKMAMQWMQRNEIDREIDKQMGIRPSSTRPTGPASGIHKLSMTNSSPNGNITYFFKFKKID